MRKLVIATLLLLSSMASAAEPKVPAKLTLSTGQLQRLEIPLEKTQKLVYKSTAADDELFVDELIPREGKTRLLLQGSKDGTYYLAFLFEGDKEIVFCQVIVGKGLPAPKPVPDPTPVPPVVTGKLKAYFITESADKNINYTKMLASKAVKDYWNGKGYDGVVVADPDVKDPATNATPVKLKPYIDRAKGLKDQLYLVDTVTGDVAFEGNAPQSEGDFLTLLKRLAGGD